MTVEGAIGVLLFAGLIGLLWITAIWAVIESCNEQEKKITITLKIKRDKE
jgi:hypothetical protein